MVHPSVASIRRHARALAVRHLFSPRATPYQRMQAVRLGLIPIDFWRYAELEFVLKAWGGNGTVVDIGSPKILASWLGAQGARVVSCDIHPKHAEEMGVYRNGGFSGLTASGMQLPFADASVDFAYSVSVIEHIYHDGDIKTLAEIARILKPGGRAVVTVPIAPEYHEVWHNADTFGAQETVPGKGVFFCRVYDRAALAERLAPPPALTLESIQGAAIRDPAWYERYRRNVDVPRSLRALWIKSRDQSHAKRHIAPFDPTNDWPSTQGVAALSFRRQ